MIQERRYAYSVRWCTLMNIVVTEIYGDRKQTDWQGKMLQWLADLFISSLYSVLKKVMSERVVMSLTAQSPPRMDPSRRDVSLTFQSWRLLRLQVFEGRCMCWQKANNDKVKFYWEKTHTVYSALAPLCWFEKMRHKKVLIKSKSVGKKW